MTMKKDLFERLNTQLEKERKNRKIAFEWIEFLSKELPKIVSEIYGYMEYMEDGYLRNATVKVNDFIYFRFEEHKGENTWEDIGFYLKRDKFAPNYWGEPVYEMKGKEFWYAVREIYEWVVNKLLKDIEQNLNKREELIDLIINGYKKEI